MTTIEDFAPKDCIKPLKKEIKKFPKGPVHKVAGSNIISELSKSEFPYLRGLSGMISNVALSMIGRQNDSHALQLHENNLFVQRVVNEPDDKDIQKALNGFDVNLDLNNITSNIGKPGETSPNDQQKGIVTYKIPKKVDWWTLKRAAGPEKPSTETVLNPEIIDSILDRMAQVSTTQDQLANTMWTSLEDLLRAAEDHMSGTNYKKFYKETKKKYPKVK